MCIPTTSLTTGLRQQVSLIQLIQLILDNNKNISLIKLKNNIIMILFSFLTGFLDYLTLGPAASIALQVQPSWKTLRYFVAYGICHVVPYLKQLQNH